MDKHIMNHHSTPVSPAVSASVGPAAVGSSPLFQPLSQAASQQIQGGYWAYYASSTRTAAADWPASDVYRSTSYTAPTTAPVYSVPNTARTYSHQLAANHLDSILLG